MEIVNNILFYGALWSVIVISELFDLSISDIILMMIIDGLANWLLFSTDVMVYVEFIGHSSSRNK